ncbi:MAG: FAD-dependent oxidoreductase [Clostridiaceae bacterium]
MPDRNYDIIVAGGGLSGVAAAAAAAREGCRVLIAERYGFLGGMATAGLVNPFMPYTVRKAKHEFTRQDEVNRGIFREMLENLAELDGLHPNRQTFNEEILKLVLDRMMKKYNVKVMFHSFLTGAKRIGNKIETIAVTNKSGVTEFSAKYFIDATGDADLSMLAGCEFKIGRDADHLCQPMTLCFRLANVDRIKYNKEADRTAINEKYKEFKRKGIISNPRENVLVFDHMVDDVLHFNSTRIIKKCAVDAVDLSEAEIQAREQVYELFRFMKENIPGFENAQILMSAAQIGVRESRRIVGEYTITQDDLLKTIKFEDSIARGTYPVDIHNPDGSGTIIKEIPYEDYYTIPYRALIPKGIDNLIAAGRPISSTHEAHSAYRVMPICACIGEGAGAAAAIAVKDGGAFRDVDVKKLHEILDRNGALY